LQTEAALLRSEDTKLVALGIGSGVDVNELNGMATDPDSQNVIQVDDFSQLNEVEQQLRDVTCLGRYTDTTYDE